MAGSPFPLGTDLSARAHLSLVATPSAPTTSRPYIGDRVTYIGVCRRVAVGEIPEQIVAVVDVIRDETVTRIVDGTRQQIKTGKLVVGRRFADRDTISNNLTAKPIAGADRAIYRVAQEAIELAERRGLDVGPAQSNPDAATTYDPFQETPQAQAPILPGLAP